MGNYTSAFMVSPAKAASNHTHPNKPNWITLHAVASELSIAEVERLWLRFRQLGSDENGELTESVLMASPIWQDAFSRNVMKKFMDAKTKKITFENFLRGLRWCEMATLEEKLRGVFRLMNNGNEVPKEIFKKIVERVYTDPKDKEKRQLGYSIQRNFILLLFSHHLSGSITEDQFVRGCQQVPRNLVDDALNFELLPSYMKERLHQNLPEFSNEGQMTPVAGSSGIPSDTVLKDVALKIHKRDWERVANKLDIMGEDIDELRSQYKDPRAQVYQMLKLWKSRDQSMASTGALQTALRGAGMADVAQSLS
ncbi:hypothetical protein FSP39_004784 [Pinctada imbricata]|uniref:Death domain-containing protein n=1 Tax=Pinctada imbricata TaxID=66713 RepID=A0AA89BW20_PINIB|nr:hypothetical protein FSP39_004784 [Pinctada imbricata]